MSALTYAIGDVHGRLDLLVRAHQAIRRHGGGRIVHLGDYVDRGPDSRGVVEFLIDLGEAVVCLKGNHEQIMVDALRRAEPVGMAFWLRNGGDATLASYGGEPVPAAHLDWMDALPVLVRDEHRVYVHAGLFPETPIAEQDERDCLWIRHRFLAAPASAFELHVVHGHTPIWLGKPDPEAPERLPHRTNLDTQAWNTGLLSVGVFDDGAPGGPVEVLEIR